MCVCAITFDFFTSPIKNLLKNLRIIRPILTSIINICKNVYKIKCNDNNTFYFGILCQLHKNYYIIYASSNPKLWGNPSWTVIKQTKMSILLACL